jgi:isoamylase
MRERMVRNLFASLAFSQGVPMISHGDELGRTQKGNNNAYCQDNPLAWIDWDLDQRSRDLLEFARTVFRIRRSNPVFRRRRYFAGDPVSVEGAKDVSWVRPDGSEMEEADWGEPANRVLGMLIHGEASDELDERGRPNRGETLLLLMNGGRRAKLFQLPTMPGPGQWHEMLNTTHPTRRRVTRTAINLVASSLLLLRYEEAR